MEISKLLRQGILEDGITWSSELLIERFHRYRYRIDNTHGTGEPAIFIGLNPSLAGSFRASDPTVKALTQAMLGTCRFLDPAHSAPLLHARTVLLINLFTFVEPNAHNIDYSLDQHAVAELETVLTEFPHAPIVCGWGKENNSPESREVWHQQISEFIRRLADRACYRLELPHSPNSDGSLDARSWSPRGINSALRNLPSGTRMVLARFTPQ